MTEQEKREIKEAKQHKRAKRAERALHNRGAKNFFLWLLGFLMGIILLVSSVAVVFAVLPIKTYVNLFYEEEVENPPVSEAVWEKSLLGAITNFSAYNMGDFHFVKGLLNDLLNGSGLDGIITIDVTAEGFDEIKFVAGDDGSKFVEELQKYIRISPEAFGTDFAKLDVFMVREVPLDAIPTPANVNDTNPKMYCYLASGTEGDASAVYKRAFTDEGEYAQGVTAETKLYYNSLANTSVADLKTMIGDRIEVSSVSSIISCFTELTEESLITKILKDTTVAEIGTFDTSDIMLKDVLNSDDKFYDILSDATGVDKETIKLGDLENVTPGNIKLQTVLKNADDLYDILVSALNKDADKIVVDDLANLQTSAITLSSVIDPNDSNNDKIYSILVDATGKQKTEMTIADLSSLDTNEILLSTVIDPNDSANDKLYNILVDATGGKQKTEMKIKDLSSLNTNAIKLSVVLDANNKSNDTIYNILVDATGKAKNEIVVDDLSNFSTANIRLVNVLDPTQTANETIYNILADVKGIDKSSMSDQDYQNALATITVSDLSNLDVKKIRLANVLDTTTASKLYDIILGAVGGGKTAGTVTVGDLENMDTDNIKLNTVLTESTDLLKIIADATDKTTDELTVKVVKEEFTVNKIKISSLGITSDNTIITQLQKDDTVTVGNLGEKIDNLYVKDIYNVVCFTKTAGISATGVVYQKSTTSILDGDKTVELDVYTYYTGVDIPTEDNDLYYISNKSTIWLFMLYSYEGSVDATSGLAMTYTQKATKFTQLQDTFASASSEMTEATIRQFVDCGLLASKATDDPNDYQSIYASKIQEIIDAAAGRAS